MAVNNKKVYRIYREENRMLRRRRRKKLIVQRNPVTVAEKPNDIWAMDFVFDTTETGGNLKHFVVLDEFSRYLIAAEVSGSISSTRVIGILENAIMRYGKPGCLKTDNGPELVSRAMMMW